MTGILLSLAIITTALLSANTHAATANCTGKVQAARLYFEARGSLMKKRDGVGHVKINNRVVAEFDGDAARINFLTKTFSIRNERGDVVEGKLHSVRTGASTLTKMILPGEGVRLFNVPVNCSVR